MIMSAMKFPFYIGKLAFKGTFPCVLLKHYEPIN